MTSSRSSSQRVDVGAGRGVVVGCRQQRPTNLAEAAGYPLGELEQRGRRLTQARPLVGQMTLEMIHIGLEEVAAGAKRVDLGLDVEPLALAGSACLFTGLVEQSGRHLAGGIDRLGRFGARLPLDPLGFGLGLGNGGVGGPLGKQQSAADGLGLVDRRRRRGGDRNGRRLAGRDRCVAARSRRSPAGGRPPLGRAPPSPSTGSGRARVRRRPRSGTRAPRRGPDRV